VQEYLKNLHIEYQFGCLSEKKANGEWRYVSIGLTSKLNISCLFYEQCVIYSVIIMRL
jgi:hypothetical protein